MTRFESHRTSSESQPLPAPYPIERLKHLSLDELLEREQTSLGSLEATVNQKLTAFPGMAQRDGVMFIDTLYNLRKLTHDDPQAALWQKPLESLDTFFATFFPNPSLELVAAFRSHLSTFVATRQHPVRLIRARNGPNPPDSVKIYESSGDWKRISPQSSMYDKVVDMPVLAEALDLQRNPSNGSSPVYANYVYHLTSSSAVPGILREGAVLGTTEALARGIIPQTGAFAVENHRRAAVYADTAVGVRPYGPLRWFDEYAVCLKINIDKQHEFIRRHHVPVNTWNYGTDPETGARMLGPVVPLEHVEAMYGWKMHLSDLTATVGARAPHVQVQSSEAMVVLEEDREFLNRLLYPGSSLL